MKRGGVEKTNAPLSSLDTHTYLRPVVHHVYLDTQPPTNRSVHGEAALRLHGNKAVVNFLPQPRTGGDADGAGGDADGADAADGAAYDDLRVSVAYLPEGAVVVGGVGRVGGAAALSPAPSQLSCGRAPPPPGSIPAAPQMREPTGARHQDGDNSRQPKRAKLTPEAPPPSTPEQQERPSSRSAKKPKNSPGAAATAAAEQPPAAFSHRSSGRVCKLGPCQGVEYENDDKAVGEDDESDCSESTSGEDDDSEWTLSGSAMAAYATPAAATATTPKRKGDTASTMPTTTRAPFRAATATRTAPSSAAAARAASSVASAAAAASASNAAQHSAESFLTSLPRLAAAASARDDSDLSSEQRRDLSSEQRQLVNDGWAARRRGELPNDECARAMDIQQASNRRFVNHSAEFSIASTVLMKPSQVVPRRLIPRRPARSREANRPPPPPPLLRSRS